MRATVTTATVASGDGLITADSTEAPFTLTLPDASTVAGQEFMFVYINPTPNTDVTIMPAGRPLRVRRTTC